MNYSSEQKLAARLAEELTNQEWEALVHTYLLCRRLKLQISFDKGRMRIGLPKGALLVIHIRTRMKKAKVTERALKHAGRQTSK